MKIVFSAGAMLAALLLSSCADPKAVDISVPPNSASSATVTTSSTVVTTPVTTSGPAPAADTTAATAPAYAPEDTKWKMHVDDRTLICGPHDRDLGRCD